MTDEIQYDVRVENAFKSYNKKTTVLKGLNMNVASGSIYALLGPSGCGKSTLLRCILGTMELDSGCIDLKAKYIKDIGYMPQHLCLDETLTIKETIEYYGSLYNMSVDNIKSRIIELNKFLQLPNTDKYIKNISGGQSRRLSLAISLLHDPQFIILDEPTVGIDPLMRYEIWKEFKRMVEQCQKTIIVTTHYIEEANQANCIGFMRHGQIIEEGSPQHVLDKYQTDSLESCFLTACHNERNNETTYNSDDNNEIQVPSTQKSLKKLENNVCLYRIRALMNKQYRVCSRDYIILYSVILLPIIQCILFNFTIGRNFTYMPIAVKNDEIDFETCQYSDLNGCIFDENNNQPMSCAILNHLRSLEYNLIEVEDRNAGELSMTKLNSVAFLYFPKNYTKEFAKYFDDRKHYKIENLNYVDINKDNFWITIQVSMDIVNSIKYLITKTLNGCSNNPKNFFIPFEHNSIYENEMKTHTNSIVNFFMAIASYYIPSMFTVSIMMSEKMDGHFNRSMYAGVKIVEMVFSVFCVSTMMILIQMCTSFNIIFVMFNFTIPPTTHTLVLYLLQVLIIGWNGFFFGLFIAVTTPTKIGGIYMIIGSSVTQLLLSGALWPVEGQSKLLQALSELLPIRISGKMMTNIALKGWTLDDPSIIVGTMALISYIVTIILILIVVGRYKKDLWVIQK